ncbi:CD27 antigen [Ornithorhynchus anatinus]|uniref:CD27 antigen n=1 Tax=Ornithorhynchus anatinus TaxID=9258 RepID=UPI0010A80561|nr:CD27 antigen [Ornithorhynchus anatinus]
MVQAVPLWLGALRWFWAWGALGALGTSCPEGQYLVGAGTRCCLLCDAGRYLEEDCGEGELKPRCSPCSSGFSFTPKPNSQRQCESCQICRHAFLQKCNVTSNSKCGCQPGLQCQDQDCTYCVPQLKSPQARSTARHHLVAAGTGQPRSPVPTAISAGGDSSASAGSWAATTQGVTTSHPRVWFPPSSAFIRMLAVFSSLLVALILTVCWLLCEGRRLSGKPDPHAEGGAKRRPSSGEELCPCRSPQEEEGSTLPIQEDCHKPDLASYP